MGYKINLLLMQLGALLLLFLSASVVTVNADAVVTGTVFCDQCKDGGRSLFDYPLYGARVAVKCGDTTYGEEGTNWFGGYTVSFDGSPDLSQCYARVVSGPARCGAAAGPAKELRLLFRFLGMEMYMVDPLVAQPAEPMRLCPHAPSPPTVPGYMPPQMPLPPPPINPTPIPTPPIVPVHPPPAPGLLPPPFSFLNASACTYDKWMMPEFKCYWKVVSPDTPVSLAFGPVAAGKYEPDMTLWDGLQGRGELYRTLLREGTTSLLNSYNTLGFCYPTLRVINLMNWALLGSSHDALLIALKFRRANSGSSGDFKASCNFNPCS